MTTLVFADNKKYVQIKCSCGKRGYKWRPELDLGSKIIDIWRAHHTCS